MRRVTATTLPLVDDLYNVSNMGLGAKPNPRRVNPNHGLTPNPSGYGLGSGLGLTREANPNPRYPMFDCLELTLILTRGHSRDAYAERIFFQSRATGCF